MEREDCLRDLLVNESGFKKNAFSRGGGGSISHQSLQQQQQQHQQEEASSQARPLPAVQGHYSIHGLLGSGGGLGGGLGGGHGGDRPHPPSMMINGKRSLLAFEKFTDNRV